MFPVIKLFFECQHCGNCCAITRTVHSEEVERISKAIGESFNEVEHKLNSYPCGYLENNLCLVHYIKPYCCKHYPSINAYDTCPAYRELADKIYVDGAMHKVCNDHELAELYKRVLLNNDYEAAYELLDRLNIKR